MWREAAASHPGPFDLGPAVVAYDLVAVRRVALARFAGAVTRHHLQLGRCRGHLYSASSELRRTSGKTRRRQMRSDSTTPSSNKKRDIMNELLPPPELSPSPHEEERADADLRAKG